MRQLREQSARIKGKAEHREEEFGFSKMNPTQKREAKRQQQQQAQAQAGAAEGAVQAAPTRPPVFAASTIVQEPPIPEGVARAVNGAVRVYEGALTPIVCNLPGFVPVRPADDEPGFWCRVWYRTNNAFGVMHPGEHASDAEVFQYWASFVRRVEWNLTDDVGVPLPVPYWENPASFGTALGQVRDLVVWMIGVGYEYAKVEALGPNLYSASTKPAKTSGGRSTKTKRAQGKAQTR
jgi:hypothetical protein